MDNTPDALVAQVFEWRRGFNAMYLIDLGLELGLFQTLAAAPGAEPREVARRLGLHPEYVATWFLSAYGFGLLDSAGDGRFRLAPHVDAVLADADHPRYLGGYVQLGTQVAAEDFRRCREAFRTGRVTPFQGRGTEFARVVARATAGLQVVTAQKILPSLPELRERLDCSGQILEVGCGAGGLLIRLARAFPSCRCVGIDIDPAGLALARKAVGDAGLAARVELLEGDVTQLIAPDSFDAVVMVEVLHEIAPAARPGVLTACAQALRPGGWLVVVDETYPSTLAEARSPEFRFPLQTGLEELTWGNVMLTREEQDGVLRQTGFTGDITRRLIGEGFTVLTTRRA